MDFCSHNVNKEVIILRIYLELCNTQDPKVYETLPVVAAETPSNLLSHADEIRLAGLVAVGKVASAKLAKGRKSAALIARLDKEVTLAEYARTELIARNQGLVGKVARRYFETGLTHEDR